MINMEYVEKNFKIEILDIDLECDGCHMEDNCARTYKECRLYNNVWKQVDKAINKFRKQLFKEIVKE